MVHLYASTRGKDDGAFNVVVVTSAITESEEVYVRFAEAVPYANTVSTKPAAEHVMVVSFASMTNEGAVVAIVEEGLFASTANIDSFVESVEGVRSVSTVKTKTHVVSVGGVGSASITSSNNIAPIAMGLRFANLGRNLIIQDVEHWEIESSQDFAAIAS